MRFEYIGFYKLEIVYTFPISPLSGDVQRLRADIHGDNFSFGV